MIKICQSDIKKYTFPYHNGAVKAFSSCPLKFLAPDGQSRNWNVFLKITDLQRNSKNYIKYIYSLLFRLH